MKSYRILKLIVTFNVLILLSCDNSIIINYEKVTLAQSGIKLREYKVIDEESSAAFGDFSTTYTFKLSNSEMVFVKKQVDSIINDTSNKYNWQTYQNGYKMNKKIEENEEYYYYLDTNLNTLFYEIIED